MDGHLFADPGAGEMGPLLVSQCHAHFVLLNIQVAHDSATGY